MFTREEIITALQEKGYDTKPVSVSKNNVTLDGIQFSVRPVAPIIYTDALIKDAEAHGMTLDEVVSGIIETYEAHRAPAMDFNEIMTVQYIKDHIKIGLQRTTSEEIIKRPCALDENIEEYLYITIDMGGEGAGSAKIKPDMLDGIGMEPETAWSYARENTFNDITVEDMSVILAAFGMGSDTAPGTPTMLVISNHDRIKGAAAILDRETLEKIGKDYDTGEIIIIPSSIHECIIIPHTEHLNIDEVTEMVMDVNKSVVDPVDQLGDRAYIVTL